MKYKFFLLAVMTCVLASCKQGDAQGEQPQHYKTIQMSTTDISLDKSYSASIKGRQDIKILPRVDGYLTQVLVKEGEKVAIGQTLFVIDEVPFRAAYEAAKAQVAVCEAQVATAKLSYDSKKALFKQQIVSEFDLLSAENSYKTAQATLLQAKANAELAGNNLSYTQVKSPANGVVGKLPYRKGDYVSPNLPDGLTMVSDNSTMYVYFSMTENNVLNLLKEYGSMQHAIDSMPLVSLRLNNGTTYSEKGNVESMSGVIDEQTGAVSVRSVFKNEHGLLLSGASGVVLIPTHYSDVMIIPQEATYEIQNKTFVYKVKDGVAHSAIVEVEPINDGKQYIVKQGLNQGEVIIAEGAGLVREGTKIKI